MLNLISKIIFTQTPRDAFPTRNKSFTLTLVNSVETTNSWKDLTDTAKIKFPKKVYFTDEQGRKVTWEGKQIIGNGIGGQVAPPILLRGDKVQVYLGYDYDTAHGRKQELNLEFEGYVTNVNPRIPLEIECQDAMYLMKQCRVPNKVFAFPAYNVRTMLQEMITTALADTTISSYIRTALQELNVRVVSGTPTSTIIDVSVGTFRTQNDTIATVLERLKKDTRIYTYFRKVGETTELRCSGIVYFPNDAVRHKFQFQKNIVSDSLEYKRQDDIQLGAKVYSVNKVEQSTLTKAGKPSTKHSRLETFVGAQGGEIRTLYFWDVTSVDKLKALGEKELAKFYYEGFFGNFTAFGLPSVKHGDIADLSDDVLPERNGSYYIKGVSKSFTATGGFRQKIDIHFKVYNADGSALFSQEQINAGL